MDLRDQWEVLVKKAQYKLYNEDFSCTDNGRSFEELCEANKRYLGKTRYSVSENIVTTILNIIENTTLAGEDFVLIALKDDDNYERNATAINGNIRANFSRNGSHEVFILHKHKNPKDIRKIELVTAKYIIVPQDGEKDILIYESLNRMRETYSRDNAIILIDNRDHVLVKNSTIQEITRLQSAIECNISRDIRILGTLNEIVRAVEKISDTIYLKEHNNMPTSYNALNVLKDILVEDNLARICELEHVSENFQKGQLFYHLSLRRSNIVLDVSFNKEEPLVLKDSNEEKETPKTDEDEIRELRHSMIQELKEKDKGEYVERSYLVQMIKDLSLILK